MNRRSFLGAILAAGMAPAVIRSGVLMPIRDLWTPSRKFSELTLAEIIAVTIRQRAPQIAANITANNALLMRLKQPGYGIPNAVLAAVDDPDGRLTFYSRALTLDTSKVRTAV